jgi:hypothetical protein
LDRLNPDLDSELRFKRITLGNWLDPDPTLQLFVRPSVVGAIPISADEWTRRFLAIELDALVPVEIRRLFAVARGILVYGALFYPFYGLGEERLFVVADAAVLERYRSTGGLPTHSGHWPPYAARLRALADRGILDAESLGRWQSLRELRNIAAHPDQQTLTFPAEALQMLAAVARDIDALFAERANGW